MSLVSSHLASFRALYKYTRARKHAAYSKALMCKCSYYVRYNNNNNKNSELKKKNQIKCCNGRFTPDLIRAGSRTRQLLRAHPPYMYATRSSPSSSFYRTHSFFNVFHGNDSQKQRIYVELWAKNESGSLWTLSNRYIYTLQPSTHVFCSRGFKSFWTLIKTSFYLRYSFKRSHSICLSPCA